MLRFYLVRAGDSVSEDVAKIMGVEAGIKAGVNIVAFVIEGGVMKPEELGPVDEEVRLLGDKIDSSRPVIITGRGPHWLYGVLVHNLHFASAVATWEPRRKVGVVVEAPTRELIGKGVTVEGGVVDVELGAKGTIRLVAGKAGGKALLHAEIVGDRFAEPSKMREAEYPEVPGDAPLVVEGMMPIWLGARLVAEYVHKVPAIAVYDPRLKAGVVCATHTPEVAVGDLIPVEPKEIEAVAKQRRTKVIGVLGDPNSGKSVFLHLLNDVLRKKGFTTVAQEADVTAPTQHWSLYAPEVRKELKKHMNPEERMKWIVESLKNAKESGAVDFVLADVGGGRPDIGQRVTRENMAILRYVDGVVIVSRNERGQIKEWLKELRTYLPDIKVFAILESRLEGEARFRNGYGLVAGLDRGLYRQGKVPEDTVKVVEKVAERILKGDHFVAGRIDAKTAVLRLEDLSGEATGRKVKSPY